MKEEIKGASVEQKTSPSQRTQTKIPRGDKIYQSLYRNSTSFDQRQLVGSGWVLDDMLRGSYANTGFIFIPTCAQQNTPRKQPRAGEQTDLHFIWFREKEMGSGGDSCFGI